MSPMLTCNCYNTHWRFSRFNWAILVRYELIIIATHSSFLVFIPELHNPPKSFHFVMSTATFGPLPEVGPTCARPPMDIRVFDSVARKHIKDSCDSSTKKVQALMCAHWDVKKHGEFFVGARPELQLKEVYIVVALNNRREEIERCKALLKEFSVNDNWGGVRGSHHPAVGVWMW